MWLALAVLLLAPFPVGCLLFARCASRREAGLRLVAGLAVDLLLTLVVARFVSLEAATWATRGAGLAFLAWALARRRRREDAFAEGWDLRGPLAAALVGLAVSLPLSMGCSLWDRAWHIPLVGALRAERTPFSSVYDPGLPLYYHYAGDAFASMLQILSGDHLHAATSLSRAHDLLFVVLGLFLGLSLPPRIPWFVAPLLTLLLILAGPAWMGPFAAGTSGMLEGLTNVASYSFRPSAPFGLLFSLAFCVSLLSGEALFTLALFAAVLTLCDEVALVSLGVAALPWLVLARREGRSVSQRRALLVAGVASVLCPFVFGGALSWTAAREPLHVSSGVPGFYDSVLAPGSWPGIQRLATLFTSPLLAWGLAAWMHRREEPETRHALGFFAALTLLGGVVVGSLHLGAEGTESVRFVGLPQLLAPVVALFALARLPGQRRATKALVGAAAALTLVLPSLSTLRWALGRAPAMCRSPSAAASTAFYALDCRRDGDARALERGPAPTVADLTETFLSYAGCHPVQGVGAPGPRLHEIATGGPAVGREGLIGWEPLLARDEPLTLVCPAVATSPTAFCRLQDAGQMPCLPRGDWRACAATPSTRRQLATRLQVGRPMPRGTPAPVRTPPTP